MQLTPEQQSVVDAKTSNILVAAAAGSGKTAVLVERIMKKILSEEDPVDIDQVLLVTFTNDAAAQMRDRIRKAIDERLKSDPYNKRLLRQSDRLSFAPIMTLDSFCQSVVKRYFQRLDIDPGFQILDETDGKLLWNRAVTETIEEKLESDDPAFFQMVDAYSGGKDDANLIELVTDINKFAKSAPFPDEWIRESAGQIKKIKTAEDLLESAFARYEYESLRVLFEPLADEAIDLLELCDGPAGPYYYKNAIARDVVFARALEDAGSLKDMILAAKDYYSESTAIGRKNKDTGVNPELQEVVKAKRGEIKAKFDNLKKYAEEDCFSGMAEAVKQSGALLDPLCELVIACRKRYRKLMDEENAYDFSEISHMTLDILLTKEEDGTIGYTDAALQYRKSFREIMVDEYQDSNLVQEMFLKAISGESEGRPNLFMVGDIKQSIYKFRMAKPELFMEKFDTYTQDPDCVNRLILLNKNFRSRETILCGINRIFRKLMIKPVGGVEYDAKAFLQYGADYKIPFTPEESAIEYLLVNRNTVSDENTALCAALVKRVKELTDPINGLKVRDDNGSHIATYGDIAVIVRKTGHLMYPAINALLAAGIPAYASKMSGFFDCTEVRNVLNFISILDNPYDDIPFHAVLNGPIAGFTYEELALLRLYAVETARGGKTEYMFPLIQKLCRAEFVKEEMKPVCKKAEAFLKLYNSLKQKSRYLSVPELLTELYRETGYLFYVSLMPAGDVRVRNLKALLEKAKSFASGIYTELSDFVNYINDMKKYAVNPESDTIDAGNAIRFTTIHSSKGLEYPIVFMLDLDRKFTGPVNSSRIRMNDFLGIGSAAIYPKGRYFKPTYPMTMIDRKNSVDEKGEAMRLLYVAMTRAKEKLILMGGYLEKDWDKAVSDTLTEGEALPYEAISKAEVYQKLLLPAILAEADRPEEVKKSDLMKAVKPSGNPEEEPGDGEEPSEGTEPVFVPREIKAKEFTLKLIGPEILDDAEAAEQKAAEAKPVTDEMMQVIRDFFTFEYPYHTGSVPVKVSVSDLKMSAMEEFEANLKHPKIISWEENKEEIPVPKFAAKEQAAVSPGALRGTYYHRFLELHDYQKGDTPEELRNEADALVRGGYVPSELTELISFEKISVFLQSELGQRIKKASDAGRLRREQAFVMSVPASSVSKDYDPNEKVLVQGIIDAMFEEEDGIVLLDYKTDAVPSENGEQLLKDRYTVQLRYYAEAIGRGTGKNVKESSIYSFALQKTIRL